MKKQNNYQNTKTISHAIIGMKNLILRICYYIIKLIGVDVDIQTLVNGNWQFFVTRNLQSRPVQGEVIPIQYNDVIRDYRIIETRSNGMANLIVRVEVIADRPEIKAEEPVGQKEVGRITMFFKNLRSKVF